MEDICLTSQKECSRNILTRKIEDFLSQGKSKFYLRDITEETSVPLSEVEDFLLPLLKENGIEGTLEVRCPKCGADLGSFKKYPEIPKDIYCELCGTGSPMADEFLEIVLEIKGKFFRAKKGSSQSDWQKTDKAGTEGIIEECR